MPGTGGQARVRCSGQKSCLQAKLARVVRVAAAAQCKRATCGYGQSGLRRGHARLCLRLASSESGALPFSTQSTTAWSRSCRKPGRRRRRSARPPARGGGGRLGAWLRRPTAGDALVVVERPRVDELVGQPCHMRIFPPRSRNADRSGLSVPITAVNAPGTGRRAARSAVGQRPPVPAAILRQEVAEPLERDRERARRSAGCRPVALSPLNAAPRSGRTQERSILPPRPCQIFADDVGVGLRERAASADVPDESLRIERAPPGSLDDAVLHAVERVARGHGRRGAAANLHSGDGLFASSITSSPQSCRCAASTS